MVYWRKLFHCHLRDAHTGLALPGCGNITKLLDELAVITDELVIALLPEVFLAADESGDALLQRFQCFGERASFRFAEQKMYVFGHNNIAIHV